jgi:hypothetical protein
MLLVYVSAFFFFLFSPPSVFFIWFYVLFLLLIAARQVYAWYETPNNPTDGEWLPAILKAIGDVGYKVRLAFCWCG